VGISRPRFYVQRPRKTSSEHRRIEEGAHRCVPALAFETNILDQFASLVLLSPHIKYGFSSQIRVLFSLHPLTDYLSYLTAVYHANPPSSLPLYLSPLSLFVSHPLPLYTLTFTTIVSPLWLFWNPCWSPMPISSASYLPRTAPSSTHFRRRWLVSMAFLYPPRLLTSILIDLGREGWISRDAFAYSMKFSKTIFGSQTRCWLCFHLVLETLVRLISPFCLIVHPIHEPEPSLKLYCMQQQVVMHALFIFIPSKPSLRPIKLARTSIPNSHASAPPPSHDSFSTLPPFPSARTSYLHPLANPSSSEQHQPTFGQSSFPVTSSSSSPSLGTEPLTLPQAAANLFAMDIDSPPRPSTCSATTLRPRNAFDPSSLSGEEDDDDETWKLFNRAPSMIFAESRRSQETAGLEKLVEGWGLSDDPMTGGGTDGDGEKDKRGGWLDGWFGGTAKTREGRKGKLND
jgi:hypothetical protein